MVLVIPTHIKRNDTHMITGNQIKVFFRIVEGKGKYTVQIFKKIDAFFAIESEDDFAV